MSEYPSDWSVRSLGEVAERIRRTSVDQNLDVLTISSTEGWVDQKRKWARDMAGKSIDKYTLLERGEFSYNRGNSKTYPQGCIFRLESWDRALVPNVYHSFRVVNPEIDGGFVQHFFAAGGLNEQLRSVITSSVRDNGLLNITADTFFASELPIPPLPEQKKIAEILSGVDQRLSSLRKKKQKVEHIYRACSSDLFGSASNHVPLSDICDLQVGFPFRSTDFRADGIRLLRGENVGYGKPDWERSQFLPPSLVESGSQYHLNAGDIVIGMDRSFTKQGFKVSRISQADLPCLLVQRVGRFMPKGITGSYLWHILQSVQYQTILSTSEKGMDIPHLSKSEILEPLVPLADDGQQAQICTCLDSLMYSLSAVSCSIKITAQLAIALRSDLLSGRKRVTL